MSETEKPDSSKQPAAAADLATRQKLNSVHEARTAAAGAIQSYRIMKVADDSKNTINAARTAHAAICNYITEIEPLAIDVERQDILTKVVLGSQTLHLYDSDDTIVAEQSVTFEGLTDILHSGPVLEISGTQEGRETFRGKFDEEEISQAHPIGLHVLENAYRAMNRFLQNENLMIEMDETRNPMQV